MAAVASQLHVVGDKIGNVGHRVTVTTHTPVITDQRSVRMRAPAVSPARVPELLGAEGGARCVCEENRAAARVYIERKNKQTNSMVSTFCATLQWSALTRPQPLPFLLPPPPALALPRLSPARIPVLVRVPPMRSATSASEKRQSSSASTLTALDPPPVSPQRSPIRPSGAQAGAPDRTRHGTAPTRRRPRKTGAASLPAAIEGSLHPQPLIQPPRSGRRPDPLPPVHVRRTGADLGRLGVLDGKILEQRRPETRDRLRYEPRALG